MKGLTVETSSNITGAARGVIVSAPVATLLLIGGADASAIGNQMAGAILWLLGILSFCVAGAFALVLRKRIRAHARDLQAHQQTGGRVST
jgi:hypothetical protein